MPPSSAGPPARSAAPAPSGVREGPDRKRLRILEAARRVCARDGYESATMDAVAGEARVSKGTLYNFFASKEQLFLSTVLHAYEESEARVEARVGPADGPLERLQGFLDALVEGFPAVAAGMMVNLQVWAVVSRDADARAQMFDDLSRRYARSGADLEATLAAGQHGGLFRSDFDPAATAAGLLAVFDGFVYRSVFDPDHAGPEALRAALDALIRQRVLAPPAEARR